MAESRTRFQAAVHRVSYNITLAFIWPTSHHFEKTPLWFPRSQHVSHSMLAVTLRATQEPKTGSLFKCRMEQKWEKKQQEIKKCCNTQLCILQDARGSTRPGFQRWNQGSGSVDSPSPPCPSPQEHSSTPPKGEELSGCP